MEYTVKRGKKYVLIWPVWKLNFRLVWGEKCFCSSCKYQAVLPHAWIVFLPALSVILFAILWFYLDNPCFLCALTCFLFALVWFICALVWFICALIWFICALVWFICALIWFICALVWFICALVCLYVFYWLNIFIILLYSACLFYQTLCLIVYVL
jgi:hypothetical protein